MYFWALNANIFPAFLYHPYLSLQVKRVESSEPGTKVCFNRWHHEEFKNCFSQEFGVVFWNDVCSVMAFPDYEHNSVQWLLFIDFQT